ncbi:hypothetical protein BS78_03G031100 [Paspalum vaginatum]|nr:hypothetical protein BS78_03G031100 [Paspalum vaginatum]
MCWRRCALPCLRCDRWQRAVCLVRTPPVRRGPRPQLDVPMEPSQGPKAIDRFLSVVVSSVCFLPGYPRSRRTPTARSQPASAGNAPPRPHHRLTCRGSAPRRRQRRASCTGRPGGGRATMRRHRRPAPPRSHVRASGAHLTSLVIRSGLSSACSRT